MGIAEYGADCLRRLLARLAYQASVVVRMQTPDAVRDLRVAVRRFSQALAALGDEDHHKTRARIRQRLKEALRAAGAVRDCDIALEAAANWKAPEVQALREKIRVRRGIAAQLLVQVLKRWAAHNWAAEWRTSLELGNWGGTSIGMSSERIANSKLIRMAKKFFVRGGRAATDANSGKNTSRVPGVRREASTYT